MAKTPNLGLHQWQPGDSFLREEFNQDFSKIDARAGEGTRCKAGSYAGSGGAGRVINLGVRPKLAILIGELQTDTFSYYCMLHVTETHIANMMGSDLSVYTPPAGYASLVENGISIAHAGLNVVGRTYSYVAFY